VWSWLEGVENARPRLEPALLGSIPVLRPTGSHGR